MVRTNDAPKGADGLLTGETIYGTVPDTLITCVFATLGGECGIMGWIKTTKDRNRERKWEQEDKQEAKAEAAEVPPGDMPGA